MKCGLLKSHLQFITELIIVDFPNDKWLIFFKLAFKKCYVAPEDLKLPPGELVPQFDKLSYTTYPVKGGVEHRADHSQHLAGSRVHPRHQITTTAPMCHQVCLCCSEIISFKGKITHLFFNKQLKQCNYYQNLSKPLFDAIHSAEMSVWSFNDLVRGYCMCINHLNPT